MFDVGDIGTATFSNWVLKIGWLSGLWNNTFVFYTFIYGFSKSKNMAFYVFFSCCTRFLKHWATATAVKYW